MSRRQYGRCTRGFVAAVLCCAVLRVGLPEDLRPCEARQSLLCVLQVR